MTTPLLAGEGPYACADLTPEICDWFAEDVAALHNQLGLLANATDLTPEVQDLALQLQEAAIRAHRLSLQLVAITTAKNPNPPIARPSRPAVISLVSRDEILGAIPPGSVFTTDYILEQLEHPATRGNQMRASAVLRDAGLIKTRQSIDGRLYWVWHRPPLAHAS